MSLHQRSSPICKRLSFCQVLAYGRTREKARTSGVRKIYAWGESYGGYRDRQGSERGRQRDSNSVTRNRMLVARLVSNIQTTNTDIPQKILPKPIVCVTLTLLLAVPLRKHLSFVHLCNLFGPSCILC